MTDHREPGPDDLACIEVNMIADYIDGDLNED
jgi:hypothetical protein